MSTLENVAGVTAGAIETPQQPAALAGAFATLITPIRRALVDTGYATPTPVQEQCIPHLLARRDLLGSAQTGTGKTAAFVLPLLQNIADRPARLRPRSPRVLILAPTRELAVQINDSIRTYSRHLRVSHTAIFGGVGQRPQEKAMSRGVDFLVATPGRLLDLVRQRFIDLAHVETLVLDEADRMLDMGFIHDIRAIIELIPVERQTLFFSATLAPAIVSLATTMLKEPVRVTIAPEQPTVERIAQKVMFVSKGDKNELLVSLLRDQQLDRVIIFTQMKHAANKVADHLLRSGVTAAAIHGNKSQAARMRALSGFREGRVRALVATDVAARGIDVDGITHVINYNLPVEPETYVHRIGRTGRAGSDGIAVAFCSAEERALLMEIERLIRQSIPVDAEHSFHCETAASVQRQLEQPPQVFRGKFRRGNAPAGRGNGRSSGRFRPHRRSRRS